MMEKKRSLVVISISLLVLFFANFVYGESISKDKAIEIANQKVVELGYNPDDLEFDSCNDKNGYENLFSQFQYPPEGYKEFLNKIPDNSSWIVLYRLKKADDKGIQLFILVDKEDGKIKSILR